MTTETLTKGPLMAPTSPLIDQIAPAFVQAQLQLESAAKDAFNPHFKTKYADLPSVIEAHRSIFGDFELSVLQRPLPTGSGVNLQTVIMHSSGQWFADGGLPVPAVKSNDPQAVGSALTYARRYGLAALIGIVQDDDDAAGAAKPVKATPKTQLAKIEDRDKLEADIKALPDKLAKQIGERVRGDGIVWTQLSKAQYKTVSGWYDECKAIADAEAGA